MNTFNRIRDLLLEYPQFETSGFSRLEIGALDRDKEDDYWGTSIKRFLRCTDTDEDTFEDFNIEGIVYVNTRDILDDDGFIRVIAHEAEHLLDDKDGVAEDIYEYLKIKLGNLT